jgi:hypothetical protein
LSYDRYVGRDLAPYRCPVRHQHTGLLHGCLQESCTDAAIAVLYGHAGLLYAGVVEDEPGFPQASEALGALARAYELAEKAVEEEPDAHRAFEMATAVTEAARQITIQLGQLRALQAVRIRDQESLSLAALADRIRVSKTRAVQILGIAAKAREGTDHG